MESILSYFSDAGVDFISFLKLGGTVLLGALLLSVIFRFIFKKQPLVGHSISSSIAIIFIYVAMVLIVTVVTDLHFLVTPLPFASLSQDSIRFFSFANASYTEIASQLMSMIILSFLVNLIDGWMPKSKHILKWTFWRLLTVIIGFGLHYLVTWLFRTYLPQGIVLYAPVFLLGILVLLLVTGALKLVVGLILSTVNPLIGALYTFFFASLIGKQITKAVLTTAILSGMIYLLQDMGISALSLAAGALVAYIPFLLAIIPVWYVIGLL